MSSAREIDLFTLKSDYFRIEISKGKEGFKLTEELKSDYFRIEMYTLPTGIITAS